MKILDEALFIQFKKLYYQYIHGVDTDADKLIWSNDNLQLRYRKHQFGSNENIKEGIKKFDEFISDICKEPDTFIKDFYLQRAEECRTKLFLKELRFLAPDSNNEICILQKKLFPLPAIHEQENFISEWISFLRFVHEKDIYKIRDVLNIEELLQPEFYCINNFVEKNLSQYFAISFENLKQVQEHVDLQKVITAKEIKTHLKSLLPKIGVDNFRIKLRRKNVFSVNVLGKVITVPKRNVVSLFRYNQLLFHEIAVHTYRSVSGEMQHNSKGERLALLSFGNNKNLAIEEGLATYFEQNTYYDSNKYDVLLLSEFYLRMIAVHQGLFFKPDIVYKKLIKLYRAILVLKREQTDQAESKSELLMKRLYRDYVFPQRGMVNPRIAQYLKGNRMLWNWLEAGGNLNNLFVGKVSIEDLVELEQMGFELPTTLFNLKEFPRELLHHKIKEAWM